MNISKRSLLLTAVLLVACEGDIPIQPVDECGISALPVQSTAFAPRVTDVTLEVQPSGIVVLATATDTEGTANLLDVQQTVAVFRNLACTGEPIVISDDLAGSGVEESFGTAVSATAEPALYAAIAGAQGWPVQVTFTDADGNRTIARVLARVER